MFRAAVILIAKNVMFQKKKRSAFENAVVGPRSLRVLEV